MGEETDGVVESTSKLQEKLKALTGVDILTDAGDYKDTYTILKEIGQEWENISDIDKAATLELMAGKNRANTLSAILSNMKDLEGAYESAMNAEGSAMRENEAFLDSIQGRINLFTNAVQTMWMNFLDTDIVKWFVDLGTAVIQFADSFGVLPTAIGAFTGIKTVISSIKADFESIKNGSFDSDIFGFKKLSTDAGVAKEATEQVAEAIKKESDAIKQGVQATEEKTEAVTEHQIAQEAENAAQQQHIAGNAVEMKSDAAEAKGTWAQVAAEKALAVAKGAIKGFAIGLALSLATSAITGIVSSIKEASERMGELTDEAIKSADETKKAQLSLKGYKDEAEKLRASLDNNTLSEQEAYDARKRLIEIQDQLIDKFGAEARGINLVTGEINAQKAAIDDLAKSAAGKWLAEESVAYNNAKTMMSEKHSTGLSKGQASLFAQTTYQGTTSGTKMPSDLIDAYSKGLKEIIEGGHGGIFKHSSMPMSDEMGNPIYAENMGISFENKTVEEIVKMLDDVHTYLLDFKTEYSSEGVNIDKEIGNIQTLKEQYVTQDYKDARELYNKGREQEAIYHYADVYGDILDAQGKIYNTKSDQERLDAIRQYNKAVDDATNAATEAKATHMVDYFSEMAKQFAQEEFELKVKVDENGIRTNLESIIKQSGEKGLSALDDTAIKDMIGRGLHLEGATDDSGAYTQEQINALASLKAQADNAGYSLEGLIGLLVKLGIIAGQPVEAGSVQSVVASVKTYAQLSEEASAYNDILTQTNAITANNIEVTQEYKDSLKELGFSEEELGQCFDENNGLIVKNAKDLRELVAEKKKELAADAKLAKSQSQLEYYNLVKELGATVNGMEDVSDASYDAVSGIMSQIDAVKQAIYQYQLLEDSLLGTTSAFEKYKTAQEVDAQNTYGDDYVSMAQTMYDALYKTGEVGTQANWEAIQALIPPEVYQHLEDEGAQLTAIYDYFNKNVLPTLTLKDDQFSIDYDAVENFVEKGMGAGIFTKDVTADGKTNLDLVEGMNLKEAAELMGMTETQAYAMFAALDKFNFNGNGPSFLSQLDDSTSGQIMTATSELEKLNQQKLALLKNGGDTTEVDKQIYAQKQKLVELGDTAHAEWQKYSQVDTAISALEKIDNKMTQLTQGEAEELGLEFKDGMTVQDALDQLKDKKADLATPTTLTVQIAKEKVENDLDQLKKDLEGEGIVLGTNITKNENGQYVITDNSENRDNKDLQAYVGLLNEKQALNSFLETGLTTSETFLSSIDSTVKSILARVGGDNPGDGTTTSNTTNNSDGNTSGNNGKESFTKQHFPLVHDFTRNNELQTITADGVTVVADKTQTVNGADLNTGLNKKLQNTGTDMTHEPTGYTLYQNGKMFAQTAYDDDSRGNPSGVASQPDLEVLLLSAHTIESAIETLSSLTANQLYGTMINPKIASHFGLQYDSDVSANTLLSALKLFQQGSEQKNATSKQDVDVVTNDTAVLSSTALDFTGTGFKDSIARQMQEAIENADITIGNNSTLASQTDVVVEPSGDVVVSGDTDAFNNTPPTNVPLAGATDLVIEPDHVVVNGDVNKEEESGKLDKGQTTQDDYSGNKQIILDINTALQMAKDAVAAIKLLSAFSEGQLGNTAIDPNVASKYGYLHMTSNILPADRFLNWLKQNSQMGNEDFDPYDIATGGYNIDTDGVKSAYEQARFRNLFGNDFDPLDIPASLVNVEFPNQTGTIKEPGTGGTSEEGKGGHGDGPKPAYIDENGVVAMEVGQATINSQIVDNEEFGKPSDDTGAGDEEENPAIEDYRNTLAEYYKAFEEDPYRIPELSDKLSRYENPESGLFDESFSRFGFEPEELNDQIADAQHTLDSIQGEVGISVSEEDFNNAQATLAKLIYQKQMLDGSVILHVDASKVSESNEEIGTVLAKLQEIKALDNEIEINAALGNDTSDLELERNQIIADLSDDETSNQILLDLGLDFSQINANDISAHINAITSDQIKNILVKADIDPTLVDEYINAEHSASGSVVWGNNIDAVTAWKANDQLTDGWVEWHNDVTKLTTSYIGTGVIYWRNANANGTAHLPTAIQLNGTAHAHGTAHRSGSWGAPRTETALTGELGPELRVRGNRWELLGEHGAEFNDVRKGDIIFNHKQTEQLLSNGYVTGRGKAFAEGTIGGSAYALWGPTSPNKSLSNTAGNELKGNPGKRLNDAANALSDSADKFKEVFDWIEVRLEEIGKDIDLKNAKLSNETSLNKQLAIIGDMIDLSKTLYNNLLAGSKEYNNFSKKLLAKIPKQYREAAQNGSIGIEAFEGEVDEKTLQAIKDYREWLQKADDATRQAEETLTEISALAKQAIDTIAASYDNRMSIGNSKIDQYDAYNAYIETDKGFESEDIYRAMINETNKNIGLLTAQRDQMQAELDKRVASGEIEKYSQDWYDAVNDIAAIDTEIIEAKTSVEDWQDAINELHWDKFDFLMSKFESVANEASNLLDILGESDSVDEFGNWTDEGITSLGLYAQQMEVAEMQAKKYEEEIDYLNKNWKKLGYTEQEYIEKLGELKDGQYDAIKASNDAKKAIVDLHKARVDAIKEGIQKEIDSYSELIQKKKEALNSEKDLYDFQKNVANQQKNIANIQRQIAALSGDNSAAARAKRAKLEAELAEAQSELNDTYYDRSVQNQQDALDKEEENFTKEKEAEMEKWDEYLKDVEKIVADSLAIIKDNTDAVYETITAMGEEYGLNITDAITDPWKKGEDAIQDYSDQFGLAASKTVDELKKLAKEYEQFMADLKDSGKDATSQVTDNSKRYQDADKKPDKKDDDKKKSFKKGDKVKAGKDKKIYQRKGDEKGYKQAYANDPVYIVTKVSGNWIQVRHHKVKDKSAITGWFKKGALSAYATGTTGVPKDQLALIDELGEELVIRPQNGRMTFMEKGTGVIPADLTENLMKWGALDPSSILEQNKPTIGVHPEIHNTEINLNISYGDVLHIDEYNGGKPEDLTKIIAKEFDKHLKTVNQHIRRYSK